jgi:hypothetical protein
MKAVECRVKQLIGGFLMYAAVGALSNVRGSHGARPFASVDCAAAALHSAGNQNGTRHSAAPGRK